MVFIMTKYKLTQLANLPVCTALWWCSPRAWAGTLRERTDTARLGPTSQVRSRITGTLFKPICDARRLEGEQARRAGRIQADPHQRCHPGQAGRGGRGGGRSGSQAAPDIQVVRALFNAMFDLSLMEFFSFAPLTKTKTEEKAKPEDEIKEKENAEVIIPSFMIG